MADIIKDDVQTYVRKLISKEFESGGNEEKAPADNRKSTMSEHRSHQK